jgi:hypothetical protein
LPLQTTETVSRKNAGKLSAMNVKWLSAISFLQRQPHFSDKPHILASAPETGFLQLKEQVTLKFENE